MSIEPENKDWTWVLERPCPECGFDSSAFLVSDLPSLIEVNAFGWTGVLEGVDSPVRPAPNVWSALEYACHVRDVHRVFEERVKLMLDQTDPEFDDWDQDATAVENGYDGQNPASVSVGLAEAAAAASARYAGVTGEQWSRPGRRSNGSVFTVETIGRYHLHDVHHHLYDVGGLDQRES